MTKVPGLALVLIGKYTRIVACFDKDAFENLFEGSFMFEVSFLKKFRKAELDNAYRIL